MTSLGLNLFNVDDTVNALMMYQNVRLHGMQAKLKAQNVQLSAYGSLQSLFTNFQSSLTNLSNAFNTVAFQAASSNTAVASAAVTNNNVGESTHTITVTSLAQAQAFASQATFSSNNTALNINETLTFTNNANTSENFSVQINSNDTLQNIRDKINNSGNNIGVTASIVASTGPGGATQYNLLLTSETGTLNQITISGDTGNNFQFNQTPAARDAVFTFDGYSETRSSNQINDVLDGLSLTLTGIGQNVTITTSSNGTNIQAGVQTAIQNMLNSYNQIITFLDGDQFVTVVNTNDDQTKSSATVLNNAFSTIKQQLQNAVGTIFNGTGDVHSLFDLGITINGTTTVIDQYDPTREVSSTGSLVISTAPQTQYNGSTTFNWKMTNDFNAIKEYFTDPASGFIANVNNEINNFIIPANDKGSIWNATNVIQTQIGSTNDQIDAEQTRLNGVKNDLIMQYSRLNAMISRFQGLSDYLDKQFSYLSTLTKGS